MNTDTTTTGQQFLRVSQAAQRYGISAGTIRLWIKDGRLRGYRPGGMLLIKADEIEALFAAVAR